MELKKLNHLAIIPDGNRRWAKTKDLPTLEGHRKGLEAIVKAARAARKLGIHTLTIWGFSTENWSRQKDEVTGIANLASLFIDKHIKEAIRDEVQIIHIGRKDRLPKNLAKKIDQAELKTAHFKKHVLNIAFDYGGHDEVLRAIKRAKNKGANFENMTGETFESYLDTAGQPYPNPDLIIRTSGEIRSSGLMIWQAAYSEYLFLEKYFPDFNEEDIENAIEEFANRQRRFGK